MKIAIVGTSIDLTDDEERDMRQFISMVLKRYDTDTTIISGGADGVDTIGIEIAKGLGFKTEVYHPEVEKWEPPEGKIGYKLRNLKIANECDELHCFSVPVHDMKCYHHDEPQEHEKTAGCYVVKLCIAMKKPTHLIVI